MALRELLKPGYQQRAVLYSILFADHQVPIQSVYFSLDERTEEDDRKQLLAEKESLKTGVRNAWALMDEARNERPKKPLAICDMFAPSQASPPASINRVLVLGTAGSGKTTLSKYIASQWASGKLWPHYYGVFWITARDLHQEELYSAMRVVDVGEVVAAIIRMYCLQNSGFSVHQIQALLRDRSKQFLLVIDGYDEVAQAFAGDTPKEVCLKGFLQAMFQSQLDLLVTSRGYSLPPTGEIKFDRRLINEGFSDKQVSDFITMYFKAVPTIDQKWIAGVSKMMEQNARLWSHVHNPLILTLTCDFYRNAHENGEEVADLTLLDLYHSSLNVFARRYLDRLSKLQGNHAVAWKNTSNWTPSNILAHCTSEVAFLQALAMKGVEKGTQRFDLALKLETLTDLPQTTAQVEGALGFGLLHECPGPQISALDKLHEFVHLTFQEYMAACHLAERLRRFEPSTYEWVRLYKYHPSYRVIFNFLCALISAKQCVVFWNVLLEQTDSGGFGHFQLLMHSLEAARCDKAIPDLERHLEFIGKILTVSMNGLWKWMHLVQSCPGVMRALDAATWSKLATLKSNYGNFVDVVAPLAGRLNSSQRALILSMAQNNERVRCLIEQADSFAPNERWTLLLLATKFRDEMRDSLPHHYFEEFSDEQLERAVREVQIPPNNQVSQLSPQARVDLLNSMLKNLNSENIDKLAKFVKLSSSLSSTERQFVLERLFAAILQQTSDCSPLCIAIGLLIPQMLSSLECQHVWDVLCRMLASENEFVRSGAVSGFSVWHKQSNFRKKQSNFRKSPSSMSTASYKSYVPSVHKFEGFLVNGELDISDSNRRLLAEFSIRSATPLSLVNDPSSYVRRLAVFWLYYLDDSEPTMSDQILTKLFEAAADKDISVRRNALIVLSRKAVNGCKFTAAEDQILYEMIKKLRKECSFSENLLLVNTRALRFKQTLDQSKLELLKNDLDPMFSPWNPLFLEEKARPLIDRLVKLLNKTSVEEYVDYFDDIAAKSVLGSSAQRRVLMDAFISFSFWMSKAKFELAVSQYPDDDKFYFLSQSLKRNRGALDLIPWTWSHLVALDYSSTYSALNSLSDFELSSTSLDQLIHAYLEDSASWLVGYYRRDIWLRFILRRLDKDNISIVVENKLIILFGAQYREPFRIDVKPSHSRLVGKLRQEVQKQAQKLGMLQTSCAPVRLPPEEKQKQADSDAGVHVHVTSDALRHLSIMSLTSTSSSCPSSASVAAPSAVTAPSLASTSTPPLLDILQKSYREMLDAAAEAYGLLLNMAEAHRAGNIGVAEDFFRDAKEQSLRVGAIVQHAIDSKFDLSAFKCREEKCDKVTHVSCHCDPTFVCTKMILDVPKEFTDQAWNKQVKFALSDKDPAVLCTHLDYMWQKASRLSADFHTFLKDISQGIGIYHAGPLKAKHRCIDKLPDYKDLGEPISSHLKDILRGTIVCRRVELIRAGLNKLGHRVCGIKDRLQLPQHDVLVHIEFEGAICEVQFHLFDLYRLKTFSHGPYDVTRAKNYLELLNDTGDLILKPFQLEAYDH